MFHSNFLPQWNLIVCILLMLNFWMLNLMLRVWTYSRVFVLQWVNRKGTWVWEVVVCFTAIVHLHNYVCGSFFVSLCVTRPCLSDIASLCLISHLIKLQGQTQDTRGCRVASWTNVLLDLTYHWRNDRKWTTVRCLQLKLYRFYSNNLCRFEKWATFTAGWYYYCTCCNQ